METGYFGKSCEKNKMSEYEKILIKTLDKAEFVIRKLIDTDKNDVPDSEKVKAYKEAMDFIESLKLIKKDIYK